MNKSYFKKKTPDGLIETFEMRINSSGAVDFGKGSSGFRAVITSQVPLTRSL
jgi:hypothetical protein